MNTKNLPRTFLDFYRSLSLLEDRDDDWGLQGAESTGLSVYEDKDYVFIEAALPGISSDKIEITFENGRLSIEGEKKEEEKDRKYQRKARTSFYYQTIIPSYIDEGKEPEATYKDGVIKVKFFKNGKKRKIIPIKKISSVAKAITG